MSRKFSPTQSVAGTIRSFLHQTYSLTSDSLYVEANAGVITASGDALYGAFGANTLVNHGVLVSFDLNGVEFEGGGGNITNTGEIASLGTDANTLHSGNGVFVNLDVTLHNMAGGQIYGVQDGILVAGGGEIYNANLGTISGLQHGIVFDRGSATVVNAGEIDGIYAAVDFENISLRSQSYNDRVVMTSQAVFNGEVMGDPLSKDTLELAAGGIGTLSSFDSEFRDFNTITVDSGSHWLLDSAVVVEVGVTLTVLGRLDNAGQIDGLVTVASGALLSNSGTIANTTGVTLNSGLLDNAGYIYNGARTAGVRNGTGVSVSGGGTVINAGTIAGGIDAVQFSGTAAGLLEIVPGAVFDGTVLGGAGTNTLELLPGSITGTLSNFAGEYRGFSVVNIDGGASWMLDGTDTLGKGVTVNVGAGGNPLLPATLANGGTINAGAGVMLSNDALFRNIAGGMVAGGTYGVSGASGTIVNAGTIKGSHAGIDLTGQISLTNLAGGYIGGVLGTGTLTNAGTIANIEFNGSAADRIIVDPGAAFRNHVVGGTGANTLELAAGGPGTLSNVGLTFQRFGTIVVDAGANWTLDRTDVLNPSTTLSDSGTLTNAGKIGNGVTLTAGGSLLNQGQIAGAIGVSLTAGGYVDNEAGASIAGTTIGIAASGATTIVNAGTIRGGTEAITFGGTSADRLVVDPGATFVGKVVGNSATTLELAGTGAATGTVATLTGLGSQFTGLTAITVDRYADWQLAAKQTIASTVDLTVDGILHNAGLIDTTVAVYGEFYNVAKVSGGEIGVMVGDVGEFLNGLNATGASIAGLEIGVQSSGGPVYNGSGDSIFGLTDGVYTSGVIDNAGMIIGLVAGAYLTDGASLDVFAGGAVRGTGASGIGVVLDGSGTIDNAGTISGFKAAITLEDSGIDRVIERPSGVLKGNVLGGTLHDTLELARGPAGLIGTLSSFGTAFSGFGTLAVDASANWVLDSTDTIANFVTLSVGGTLANAGLVETLAGIVEGGTLTNTGSLALGVELGAQPLQGMSPSGTATLDNLAGGAITGGKYGVFTAPSAAGQVTNAGMISGAEAGISLDTGGIVSNLAGGTIAGGIYGVQTVLEASIQVTNAGLISGSEAGILLEAGGTVTNLAGGIITATDHGGMGVTAIGDAVTVINAGTISAGYAAIELKGINANRVVADAGAVFVGLVYGGNTLSTLELAPGAAATGTITNLEDQFSGFGTLSVDQGANWVLDGEGFAGSVVDDGVLTGTDGAVDLGAVSGTGTLSAAAGAVLDLSGGGTFSGALSGAGTVQIDSALTLGPTASLSASTILETASVVTSANLTNAAGDNFVLSAASGTTVSIGVHSAGGNLTNAGTLTASGAGTEMVGLALSNSGLVSVSAGTLSFLGAVTNTGMMDAAGGVLSLAATVSGIGTLQVGAAGTLSLLGGAGPGQAVDFLAGTGLLDIGHSGMLTGTIGGFAGTDTIDLLQTKANALSYGNGVLTISNGSNRVTSLNLTGSFTTASFALGTDGHGGVLITLH